MRNYYYYDSPPDEPVEVRPEPEEIPRDISIDPADLSVAQLQFVIGLTHLRSGDYDRAVDAFARSSEADRGSRIVRLFLGIALFSRGDFSPAAGELRIGLSGWDVFPSYRWNVRKLYGTEVDFDRQVTALEDAVGASPQSLELQLVRGFMLYASGDLDGATRSLETLRASGDDELTKIATGFRSAVDARKRQGGIAPSSPADGTQEFLSSLEPSDVDKLEIE